ncbi:MAG: DNA-binding response regulator [Pseudonocardiales bacterium]|nr:MAG: DNA-binding response regulator [Pseudonocardiales bacterium]
MAETTRFPSTAGTVQPPAENAAIRLLVVDGHPLVRWALSHISGDAPDLRAVGEASSAAEAINQVFSLKPDVVTIDCSLPDGSGWELARALRDRYVHLGIVMLTSADSDDLLFRALDSGASAFVSKSASVHEVISAIRHSAVSASSFSATGLAQALRRRNDSTDCLALSGRERQVLDLLRDGRSVPQVAAELYVSLSTAKTYVARLYDKLGANNRAQALMEAVRLGLFEGRDVLAG